MIKINKILFIIGGLALLAFIFAIYIHIRFKILE